MMNHRVTIALGLLLMALTACGRVGSAAPVAGATAASIAALPVPTIPASPTATTTMPPTATPAPTLARPTPTATAVAITPSATATTQPTATPNPAFTVNGVPVEHFIVFPPEVEANVRRIFAHGQQLGRNPNAFSKIGDSISLTSHYLARFDQGYYRLGIYERLQPTIDHYAGSYHRFGMAVRIGLHAWIAFRPGLGDPEQCASDEHMVECELRLHNASIFLIRLGTNDTAPGDAYERALRHAIEYSIRNGIIPVLVTKSDRFEGDNRHNETMRRLAASYEVPLWDFDIVAGTLPDRGLGGDAVHLTMYGLNDYTDPAALSFGYPLSDLTGLMMLDTIRRAVAGSTAQ